MQPDFGIIIFLAIPSSRTRSSPGFFSFKYTVLSNQEYEIQFSRMGNSGIQSVYRRYRQFRQLYRSIQNSGFTGLQEVHFPSKQILNNLQSEQVNARKVRLEVWLRVIASYTYYHMFVYEFLDLMRSLPLEYRPQTRPEYTLTTTIHRLLSEPHMKLSTLELFSRDFFTRSSVVHTEYMLVFLTLLLPILSDDHAGSSALRVLRSLISRRQYKGAGDVISLIPSLSVDCVQKGRIDTHILERWFHGTREDACEVFKVLYEECISQGKERVLELVSSIQLNQSTEALTIFETWYNGQSSHQEIEPVISETKWFYWSNPNISDVKVKYRMMDRILESETEIRINASSSRITSVILQSDLRKLWDLRVISCEFCPTADPNLFDLVIKMDVRGSVQCITGPCRVTQESEQKTTVSFEALKGSLRTLYEITAVSRSDNRGISSLSTQDIQKLEDLELEEAECSTPIFNLQEPEPTGPQGDQCIVVVSVFMSDPASKFFITDLLGEDQKLLTTWSRFKRVAEGGVIEIDECKEGSLHNAVSRKALLSFNSQRKRTEEAEDLHRLSTRKLERRMFL